MNCTGGMNGEEKITTQTDSKVKIGTKLQETKLQKSTKFQMKKYSKNNETSQNMQDYTKTKQAKEKMKQSQIQNILTGNKREWPFCIATDGG